jgi:hypothetical protein
VYGERRKDKMIKFNQTAFPKESGPLFDFFLDEEWNWKKWSTLLIDPNGIATDLVKIHKNQPI